MLNIAVYISVIIIMKIKHSILIMFIAIEQRPGSYQTVKSLFLYMAPAKSQRYV